MKNNNPTNLTHAKQTGFRKTSLKNMAIGSLMCATLAFPAFAEKAWVSDEIEAPLRNKPELNADIVAMLTAGQAVKVQEKKGEYIKIKTADGQVGWLSDYYVLSETSVHAQLGPIKERLANAEARLKEVESELSNERSRNSELESTKAQLESSVQEVSARFKSTEGSAEKYASDNALLQKKLSEQSLKMTKLAKELDVARQKASTARTRYFSLVKVSENAVDIDRQNRLLQEQAVESEQIIQTLKNENQTMKAQLDTRQQLMIALYVFGGLLAGYVLSVLTPPRGHRGGSDYSSL